jgi:hypothetical protein
MFTLFTGTRAKIGAVASVAALTGGLLLTAAPAAQATQEFPPDPTAIVAADCAESPHFAVHLANAGGLSTASFTITITTPGPPDLVFVAHPDVAPGDTFDADYPTQEDTPATIVISSVGMEDVVVESAFDCEPPLVLDTTTTTAAPTTTTTAPAVQAVAVAVVTDPPFTG